MVKKTLYVSRNDMYDELRPVNVLFSVKGNPYLVGKDVFIDHCYHVILKPQYSMIHIYSGEIRTQYNNNYKYQKTFTFSCTIVHYIYMYSICQNSQLQQSC